MQGKEACWPRRLEQFALTLIVVGFLWRVGRYLMQPPLWGDEIALAHNLRDLGYLELTRRLEYCQIAPILFLWLERTALLLLGPSELSLRFLPLVAGCVALGLGWHLARMLLDPLPRLFALGFLAVSQWAVTMSTLLKPYSLDLCLSLLFLVGGVHWLREPTRGRWLVLLILFTPVALLLSYPTVFVALGVAGVMLVRLARPDWAASWGGEVALKEKATSRVPGRCVLGLGVFLFVVVVSFGLGYTVGQNHLRSSFLDKDTHAGMQAYWQEGFPPRSPVAFLGWWMRMHASSLMSYPLGSVEGGGALTSVLFVVGMAHWWSRRRWLGLLLLLGPFGMHLIAAFLGRYPYGPFARLMQHLTPAICLLAGQGLACLLELLRREQDRLRLTQAIVAGLFLLGVGGLARDVIKPARYVDARWTRQVMREIESQIAPGDPVVLYGSRGGFFLFEWYWSVMPVDLQWHDEMREPGQEQRQLWGFTLCRLADEASTRILNELQRRDPRWRVRDRQVYRRMPSKGDSGASFELLHFVRGQDEPGLARGQ